MESRLSHDGSKIIAGDWTGKVGIWSSADGKHLGDLNANPPTLETRVTVATKKFADDQVYLEQAQEKLLPFQQKIEEITKQVVSNKNALAVAEKALQEAITNVQKAKVDLDQAVADLANKSKIQNERSIALEAKKNELSGNQQKHSAQSDEFNKWNQRANQRSVQLSQIKESYRKASESQNENQDDSSYAEAVSKAKQAMEAMEKSYLHASNLTAKHKKEMEKYSALNISLNNAVAEAGKAFEEAKQAVIAAQSNKSAKDQSWKQAQQNQVTMTTKRDQAKNLVSSSENLLTQANEAIKAPAAEVAQAKSNAQISERSVSRWKAESINYSRHMELRTLYGLEDELASLDEILEESKNVFTAAQQAVDSAAAALNSLPLKISEQQQVISQKKAQVDAENTSLVKITENKKSKASFIHQVDQIQKKNQQQASSDPENKNLVEASVKLAESLALLQKDLQTADAQLQAKQQKLVEAKTAVSTAESELATIMKMRESAPKVLHEKELALKEAQKPAHY